MTSELPRRILPAGACDAHLHLYDPSLINAPPASHPLSACDVSRYSALRTDLGLSRAVIVTPAPHRVDNRVTLAAIQALGPDASRGVAVVFPDVSDKELERLHAGGIRGIRFTLAIPATAVTRIDMVEPLASRVHEMGWHIQLHMTPGQIASHRELLERLPCTLVFDHMARLADAGHDGTAWPVIESLLDNGKTWVKLSGHYLAGSKQQAAETANRLIEYRPDRLVWGSDWPHPTEFPTPPATSTTLDALFEWAPDEALRQRILVENPEQLYGFA